MKTLNLFITLLIAVCMNLSAYSQTQSQGKSGAAKTESFKVSGNCSMCRDRIEKAVKEEGVQTASWDSKTKMLAVSYNPSKTDKDKLGKKLASVGHDTEKYKAPDDVYARLPGCCHYERTK